MNCWWRHRSRMISIEWYSDCAPWAPRTTEWNISGYLSPVVRIREDGVPDLKLSCETLLSLTANCQRLLLPLAWPGSRLSLAVHLMVHVSFMLLTGVKPPGYKGRFATKREGWASHWDMNNPITRTNQPPTHSPIMHSYNASCRHQWALLHSFSLSFWHTLDSLPFIPFHNSQGSTEWDKKRTVCSCNRPIRLQACLTTGQLEAAQRNK